MATKTEIFNMALGHLAIGKMVANFTAEQSQEARIGRIYYDIALGQVLKDVPWPFATKIAALGLLEEEPNTEWGYSYRYPSDCAHFRRILSGSRSLRAPFPMWRPPTR